MGNSNTTFFFGEDKVARRVETTGDRGLSPFSKKAAMKSESLSIWEDGGGGKEVHSIKWACAYGLKKNLPWK